MPVCKQLAIKFFNMCINFYEFIAGTKSFFNNLTDEYTNIIISSSYNDFNTKIKNSVKNISELIIENCDEIINEKIDEFSEVD